MRLIIARLLLYYLKHRRTLFIRLCYHWVLFLQCGSFSLYALKRNVFTKYYLAYSEHLTQFKQLMLTMAHTRSYAQTHTEYSYIFGLTLPAFYSRSYICILACANLMVSISARSILCFICVVRCKYDIAIAATDARQRLPSFPLAHIFLWYA